MKHYEVERTIEAAPETVWAILTDGAGYTAWDSGVERLEGSIADGQKVKVFSQVSPGRAFPVKVSLDEAAGQMVWTGGMPLGLFKGVRTFRVLASGDGTHFSMREEFTGPLLGLIWRTMPDLDPSFRQFADGLKEAAEARS